MTQDDLGSVLTKLLPPKGQRYEEQVIHVVSEDTMKEASNNLGFAVYGAVGFMSEFIRGSFTDAVGVSNG